MFCKNCGKEINEEWRICPNCGKEVNSDKKDNKKNKQKEKKPIFKKWWFWILLAAIFLTIILNIGGGETEDTEQEIVELQEIGGFEQWKENDFEQKVRTVITVYLPLVNVEYNSYAVLADGNMIRVLQEDEAPVSEWEWLQNVDEYGEETEYVLYEATLEYLGQKEDDELPVW